MFLNELTSLDTIYKDTFLNLNQQYELSIKSKSFILPSPTKGIPPNRHQIQCNQATREPNIKGGVLCYYKLK